MKRNGNGELTKRDFASDMDPRWCPGCGDYSILSQVQKVLPRLGVPKEKYVFVSGIGCSSRFPYYMDTYGFHSIHGRAMTFAMGIKVANPELSVWVATGDGDALSIGGNHFIHTIRRNLDINVILFNNRIYGLTKGQYSPTSEFGKVTKSSPHGTVELPVHPISMAISAEATFVARSIDRMPKHLEHILYEASQHKGMSFVEVYQNCNIFNDGAFLSYTGKEKKDENTLVLEDGKPLIFGKNRDKGIILEDAVPKVVTIGDDYEEKDLLVHREHDETPFLAHILSNLEFYGGPVPLGIFRSIEKPTYEELLYGQIDEAVRNEGPADIVELLSGGDTWEVN